MNKRKLKLSNYGISGKRYKELCGFCEQYPEWKQELAFKIDTLKSKEITDMPLVPHGNSDATGDLAIRRVLLQEKIKIVEETAKETDEYYAPYLIKNICYGVPINYLINIEGMPTSERTFFDYRRFFFYLLDQKKKM